MKKVIRIILITVLAVVILIIGGCAVILGIIGHKGKSYWKYTETSGDIETKYTALGEHKVSYKEYDANDEIIGKYAVWYPDDLESGEGKYPVVIFANGTGSTSATYKAFREHLSSWDLLPSEMMIKTPEPVHH